MLHRAFYNLGQSHRLIMHLSKKKKKKDTFLSSFLLLSVESQGGKVANQERTRPSWFTKRERGQAWLFF
jgi:hypothetical protein